MPPRPPMNLKKEKLNIKGLKKILLYCKKYFVPILVGVICAIVGTITTIIGPEKISDLMNLITNGIISGVNLSEVFKIGIFLVSLYLIGAVFSYMQQFIISTVSQRISKKLRSDISEKINRLPLSYFDKTTKGDILSRVTNDVDTISQTLGSSTASIISAIVLFVGVTFKMFFTNWLLALVTIGTSFLSFLFMGIVTSKSQKYFIKRQQYFGDMTGHVEEVYSSINTVRSYNAIDNEKSRFAKHNNNLYSVAWKAQFLSGTMGPMMGFIGSLTNVLIIIIGISIILGGGSAVTIGTLMAFIIYARLFSQPLTTIAQGLNSIQQASAASGRVFEMLDATEVSNEDNKIRKIKNVKGNVEFKNVKFGYVSDKVVIKNFSASIKAGQKVAIVGPTGAGKTTLVNLLMRFYEIDDGDILIDNVSIKDIKREHLRDLFDMILQDTWLFNGTLRENLVYNKKNVSDKKLNKVCKAVGLSHFVATLENGYDTVIGDASALSEGQKQQITIARAMIKNSPLLILDEATSNVDTRTELQIQNAMDELTKNRTSFVIAHRLSTIKNADVILVLKEGDIVEQGNHKQLLMQNGFYTELYNSQFEDDE